MVEQALGWARERIAREPVLIYATSTPEEVAEVQKALGVEAAGALIEDALASIAGALVRDGVRKLISAGGETSGAVVKALGVRSMRVGPQIDPGVPWMVARRELAAGENQGAGADIALALKSGNFGATDFFAKALAMLDAA